MSSRGSTTAATPASASPIRYEAQPRSSCVICRKSTVLLGAGAALAGGRLHDPADQRAQVAARAPLGQLALGAGAVLDQVRDHLQLALAAHLGRVRLEPLDQSAGQLAGGDPRALREIDQLALQAVAG